MFLKALVLSLLLISLIKLSHGLTLKNKRSLIHGPRQPHNPSKSRNEFQEQDTSNSAEDNELDEDDREGEEVSDGWEIRKPKNYEAIIKKELENNDVEEMNEEVMEEISTRAGTADPSLRWKLHGDKYEMIIQIDPSFSREKLDQIRAAMWTLEETMVCFKFLAMSHDARLPKKKDRLYIRKGYDEGCSSLLGRVKGKQETIISEGCSRFYGTIMHEIMHVLGFFHEQVRTDRDKFVTISYDQLVTDSQKHQYKIRDNQKQFVDTYDFESVMHYPFNSVMKAKIKVPSGITVGQRSHLSDSDKQRLRRMYPCG